MEGDAELFCEKLQTSIEKETEKLPKGHVPIEKHGQISNERAMAKFSGEKVYHPKSTEWTLIVSQAIQRFSPQHPLSRTLYIFPVDNLSDALTHVDKTVQTVAIYPRERIPKLRDPLTRQGVDRIKDIGQMGYFSAIEPHDGIYPLQHLVRWSKSIN